MRKLLILVWLLVPVVAAAYHYGPGQKRLVLDDAAALFDEAERQVAAKDWAGAVETYGALLELLPGDAVHLARRAQLERAKAQMFVSQLPSAHRDLQGLVDDLKQDPSAQADGGELFADARDALANAQYYMTWLMRLEGEGEERWRPEIEAARQTYKLLAEEASARGDEEAAAKHCEDLESAIRLERMTLTDLQGLPLPSQ
jgi:hypothetical protein